jgi:hypothetical protein
MIVEEPRSEIELAVDHLMLNVVDFSTPEGMLNAMTAFARGLAASVAALDESADPDKSPANCQRNIEYSHVFFSAIEGGMWLARQNVGLSNDAEIQLLEDTLSLIGDLLAKKIARCDPAGAIKAAAPGVPLTENAKFVDRALFATEKLYAKINLMVGLAPMADVISEKLADSFFREFYRHTKESSFAKIGDFVTRLQAMFPQIHKKGESR